MVENDIRQTYGVVTVMLFYPIAISFLLCSAPWHEILEESGRLQDHAEGAGDGDNETSGDVRGELRGTDEAK